MTPGYVLYCPDCPDFISQRHDDTLTARVGICTHWSSADGIAPPAGQTGIWWHCNTCGLDYQDPSPSPKCVREVRQGQATTASGRGRLLLVRRDSRTHRLLAVQIAPGIWLHRGSRSCSSPGCPAGVWTWGLVATCGLALPLRDDMAADLPLLRFYAADVSTTLRAAGVDLDNPDPEQVQAAMRTAPAAAAGKTLRTRWVNATHRHAGHTPPCPHCPSGSG